MVNLPTPRPPTTQTNMVPGRDRRQPNPMLDKVYSKTTFADTLNDDFKAAKTLDTPSPDALRALLEEQSRSLKNFSGGNAPNPQTIPLPQTPNVTQQYRSIGEGVAPGTDFEQLGDKIPVEKKVITNSTNEIPNAPKLNTQQVTKLRRSKYEDRKKEPPEDTTVYTGKPRFILKDIKRNTKFQRVTLLSGFVFYPWKDCQVRKIDLDTQILIAYAQENRDLSRFIDAVGQTLADDIDIRDFTLPDFYYLLYWHRLNSYTTVPFIVDWKSKYGNLCKYKIVQTSLKYEPPIITEEEYAAWQSQGFTIPTMRDLEFFDREELEGEDLGLATRAQYFKGVPDEFGNVDMEQKIDALRELCAENGVGVLGLLKEFQEAIEHKTIETFETFDDKFDPKEWVEVLEEANQYMQLEADSSQEDDPMRYTELMEKIEENQNEINSITDTLDKGGKVLADAESITLKISILDFFPFL